MQSLILISVLIYKILRKNICLQRQLMSVVSLFDIKEGSGQNLL